jgi:hypothetical protein
MKSSYLPGATTAISLKVQDYYFKQENIFSSYSEDD